MSAQTTSRAFGLAVCFVSLAGLAGSEETRGLFAPPDPEAVLQAEERVARSETAMGRTFDPAFRQSLRERWAREAAAERLPVGEAGERATPPSALGESRSDLVYTPVVPCRVFDTRATAQGPLTPDNRRGFLISGNVGFPEQGGAPGGCGVPLGPATSVVINLTVVDATGIGNLRAWASSDPPVPAPYASVLNFGSVPGLPALANGIVLPICDRAEVGGVCTSDLWLQMGPAWGHVVGDVLGYFRALDLRREMLVGAANIGPFPLTDKYIITAIDPVVTPSRFVDCAVTCSVSVATTAPNATGSASVQSGAAFPGVAIWAGTPMAVPLVSSGTSSVVQSASFGLPANLSVHFGCFVSATGDFIGDIAQGTVAWVCR